MTLSRRKVLSLGAVSVGTLAVAGCADLPGVGNVTTGLQTFQQQWTAFVTQVQGLVAKAASIPPTAIAGFVGNRYLTFGPGLRKTISAITQRRRKQ